MDLEESGMLNLLLRQQKRQRKVLLCAGPIPPSHILERYLRVSRKEGFITNGGPLVKRLEADLASVTGSSYSVVTSSGTMALTLLLKALTENTDVARREVVTTPFTFIATASAIVAAGCTPVFTI